MNQKGFTLIELLVSTAIFIIVMVVAVGAVLAMVDTNRKAQTINAVVADLNVTLEQMTREIRTGYGINISGNGSGSGSSISFVSSDLNDAQVTYQLDTNNNCIHKTVSSGNSPGAFDGCVTPPDIVVSGLNFILIGGAAGDKKQPTILIDLSGAVGTSSAKTLSNFHVQTLTTQRQLDS